jgi:hypothetical protein
VVGVDSALTHTGHGEVLATSGFPKLVMRKIPQQAAAIVGDVKIGDAGNDIWFHMWLHDFLADIASSASVQATADDLAEALNDASLPHVGHQVVALAGWDRAVRSDGTEYGFYIPSGYEISRSENTDRFRTIPMLTDEEQRALVDDRNANDGATIGIQLRHAGVPAGFGHWILSEGRETLQAFVEGQIPQPTPAGLEEYVRFALTLASNLYSLAAEPLYVSEPISTAVLFPGNGRAASLVRRR